MIKGRGRPATMEGAWNGLIKSLMLVEKQLNTFQSRYTGIDLPIPAEISRAMQLAGKGKLYHVIPDLIRCTASTGGFSTLLIKKGEVRL